MPRLTRTPAPPTSLSPRAAQFWKRLVPLCVRLKTVRTADMPALELLAAVLATEAEARERLDREGMTTSTGAGGLKPHPCLRVAETARNQALALLDRFGLTPRSRKAIDRLWDDDDEDDE
jgi:P27 family predicted phage terminase small subunit